MPPYLAVSEDMLDLHIGAVSMDQGVIDMFNAFLVSIKSDGTYDEMTQRWFDSFDPGNIPDMPEIPSSNENGMLTVAVTSDYLPYCFLGDNGTFLGFEIELTRRFATYMKKDIQFVEMSFSAMLPYVISGKADLAATAITITDERKKSVLFTDSYFTDHTAIIYRKDFFNASERETRHINFVQWLKTGIERNLITENRWKMILSGLGVTMFIAVFAQVFGTVLGGFICWLLTRKNRFVKRLGNLYCGLIHGTPVVVVLMIAYYIIFGDTNISNVLIAVAAFTMVMGAGIAGNLKDAMETVDPAEIEAARSIGFSALGAFRAVTLPQAVRRVLPAYTNGFVELVKATAIVGYVAIADMMRAADIIRSRTYDAFFPLLLVAAVYLTVTTICVQLFKFIIRKVNRGGEA